MARKGKTYRTANGQSVDFGQLLLGNETVPALGNMNVNARGDEILPDGSISKSREQIMREYNELNTQVPQDDVIVESSNAAKADAIQEDDWVDWEPKAPKAKKKKQKAKPVETPVAEEVGSESQDQEAPVASTEAIVETAPEPEPIPEISPPEEDEVVVQYTPEIEVDSFNNKAQKHEEEVAELAEALEDAATELESVAQDDLAFDDEEMEAELEERVAQSEEEKPKHLGAIIEEQHAEQAKPRVPSGGLAAAVARTKSVDTTPKDPGQAGQSLTPGVRRI